MTSTQLGIRVVSDIRLKVDWKTLSKSLVGVAINGACAYFGKADAGVSAATSVVEAFSSLSIDREPGERAWYLMWLSIASAFDELHFTHKIDRQAAGAAIEKAMRAAQIAIKEEHELLPLDFLSKPNQFELYIKIRDQLSSVRGDFIVEKDQSEKDFKAIFDSLFIRGVTEILLKNPDSYKILTSALNIGEIAPAGLFEIQWLSYRSKLQYDFDVSPMFGQAETGISLGQAYIPLRCEWRDCNEDEDEDGRWKTAVLEELIDEWIEADVASEDCVKLIGGGPGSGKSTTVKKLARDLAKVPSIRPLYIPLQHISLDGNLRDAINEFFCNRTNSIFTMPPLSREAIESGPELVLIFDGLDEIACPGEGADEIATLFVTKLEQLQSALKGDSKRETKTLVTGRLPSFQAAKKYRGALGSNALQVMGYAPLPRREAKSPLRELDQRPLWWAKYAPLAGMVATVPSALTDERLRDVTNEPLLCYLLVLSGFAVDKWEEAADNRNLIYQKLIDEVWLRGWGDANKKSDRQGAGRSLSKKQFNSLMETIAVAAWLGGDTRVASDAGFHNALKLTHAEDAWEEFCSDGGQDVANLAMNFYLKAADESRKGFEFTHKSFGDYLAARALIRISFDICNLVERYSDLAMKAWYDATSTGVISSEILNYVRDELRLIASHDPSAPDVQNLFQALERMAKIVLQEGIPAHTSPGENWRITARNQKNSEIALWAILNGAARCLNSGSEKTYVSVGFDKDPKLLKAFIARVAIGDEIKSPILTCLSHLSAANSDLFGLEMSGSDFQKSDLRFARFDGAHVMQSNLSYCNLRNARFQRANLDNATVTGSDLSGCDFRDARLRGVHLFDATDGRLKFSERTLIDLADAEDEIDVERVRLVHIGDAEPKRIQRAVKLARDIRKRSKGTDD